MKVLCITRNSAIIGGGISGTSSAYFLRQALGVKVQIDLYEGNRIGGRLSTINVDGCEYETGGAVIHQNNRYATQLAEKLGINKIKNQGNVDVLGVYNETTFLFVGSEYSWWNAAKLLWRYGYGIIRLGSYTSEMLTKFDRVYEIQEEQYSFTSLNDLMYAIHPTFLDYMGISTKEGFKRAGFSDKIIDELIESTLRCNYGQTTSVHQFVGSVSIAGADNELFALEGGNKLLPEKLLEASEANLITEFVETVQLKDENFILKSKSLVNTYDYVIVSAPLTTDAERRNLIKFEHFPSEIGIPGKYWTTISTIVKGKIDPKFFGFEKRENVPTIIINVAKEPLFNSVGKLEPVRKCQEEEVWKIFSATILDEKLIKQMFSEVTSIKTIDWLAYPLYNSNSHSSLNFTLYDKLFYSNTMEWSASAMETSIIGARNVALLVQKNIQNTTPQPDEFRPKGKEEL